MGLMLAIPFWVPLSIVLILVVALLIVLFVSVPVNVWFRALASGAHVSMLRLVGMKMRKVDYKKLVDIYIVSQKAGNRTAPRGKEVVLSKPGSKVTVMVLPTDEELAIARDTAAIAL